MKKTNNRRLGDLVAESDASRLANEVHDTIKRYHQIAQRALKQAQRTEEQVRAAIVNEYASENAYLRRELQYSVACVHSDKELDAYNKFVEKHSQCRLEFKADGGKMPYVIQYGTGVGVCTKVCCQVCGATEDITDTSIW